MVVGGEVCGLWLKIRVMSETSPQRMGLSYSEYSLVRVIVALTMFLHL